MRPDCGEASATDDRLLSGHSPELWSVITHESEVVLVVAGAADSGYIALAPELEARLLTAERSTTPWVSRLGERVERVRT